MIVYSANGEEFQDDLCMVIDEIIGYNCETIEEAREAVIYIGESVSPKVKTEWVMENLVEYVRDCLYDQCGEYADNFEPEDNDELDLAITLWLGKQNFRCYSVKDVKEESIMNHITEEELIEIFRV